MKELPAKEDGVHNITVYLIKHAWTTNGPSVTSVYFEL